MAALAVVVGAHDERHVLDRHDERDRPEHERDHSVHVRQDVVWTGVVIRREDRLQRVQRARPDVAEDDAERAERQRGCARRSDRTPARRGTHRDTASARHAILPTELDQLLHRPRHSRRSPRLAPHAQPVEQPLEASPRPASLDSGSAATTSSAGLVERAHQQVSERRFGESSAISPASIAAATTAFDQPEAVAFGDPSRQVSQPSTRRSVGQDDPLGPRERDTRRGTPESPRAGRANGLDTSPRVAATSLGQLPARPVRRRRGNRSCLSANWW